MKGFGTEPPPDVRAGMEEKFGIEHDFMEKLSKDIAALARDRPGDVFCRKVQDWLEDK